MEELKNSADDVVECPLCMEPLEVDDLNFYPCTCGYQICRFCWHRIRTDENELCPACRKAYSENPADFTPLTQEEIVAFKSQKRQRDQQRKQKIAENRKHLGNVRVVQKNLVFVVGLPPRLADAEILKKHEYFGKYGKIHKVVINPSTTYAGVQGPSASAYVTYVNNCDALRAIQSVNNINIDGRTIKTSLGTTKYCSHFMKNQQCPKSDCMYLHELGDTEASFTKEEMHQGKHQEYEKRLHESLLVNAAAISNVSNHATSGGTNSISGSGRNGDSNKTASATNSVLAPSATSSVISSQSTSITTCKTALPIAAVPVREHDVWPSLTISPTNKDSNNSLVAKGKKVRAKNNDNLRNEKIPKSKNKSKTINKMPVSQNSTALTATSSSTSSQSQNAQIQNKFSEETEEENSFTKRRGRDPLHSNRFENNEEEINIAEGQKVDILCSEEKREKHMKNSENDTTIATNIENLICEGQCSESSSSDTSIATSISNSSNSFNLINQQNNTKAEEINGGESSPLSKSNETKLYFSSEICSPANIASGENLGKDKQIIDVRPPANMYNEIRAVTAQNTGTGESNSIGSSTAALSNLNIFDDCSSYFSSTKTTLPKSLLKSKADAEMRQNILPDLLNGIDGFKNNTTKTDEWVNALEILPGALHNLHVEDQLMPQKNQLNLQLVQDENLHMRQNESNINIYNGISISRGTDSNSDLQGTGPTFIKSNTSREMSQTPLLQQQVPQKQKTQQHELIPGNNFFDRNMSKFFDFHKNQQQLHQQVALNGSHNNSSSTSFADHSRMGSLLDTTFINSKFVDFQNGMGPSQFENSKPRQNHDQNLCFQQPRDQVHQNQQTDQQTQISNSFALNSSGDDDLGFDPFLETQKALAELMENEEVQQNVHQVQGNDSQNVTASHLHQPQQHSFDIMQRSRMPPPGFNNMNAFAFGIPASQAASNILQFDRHITSNGSFMTNVASFTQQSHQYNETQLKQMMQNHISYKAFGNNDWTAMDPAILSLRQFSFPQQSPVARALQQQDIFPPNLPQQFNGYVESQMQLPSGNNNALGTTINTHQSPQGRVNANVQGMLEYLKNHQFM